MDLGLAGKTALVTGSTGGIGLAAAVGLAGPRRRHSLRSRGASPS